MLFERSAVSLFERGKRAKQVEERERERVRERERDDDVVVVVVVVDVDVKFHSAGPRERHSFFPTKAEQRKIPSSDSEEGKEKKHRSLFRKLMSRVFAAQNQNFNFASASAFFPQN